MMPLTKWDLVENPPGPVCFVPSLQHCSSTVLDMHSVHSISNAHLCVWFRWLWSFPDTRTCKFLLQTSTPLLIIRIVKRHFEYFEKSYLFHLQSFDLLPHSILLSCLERPQSRYWAAMLSNNRRYPSSFGHFSSIASPSLAHGFPDHSNHLSPRRYPIQFLLSSVFPLECRTPLSNQIAKPQRQDTEE